MVTPNEFKAWFIGFCDNLDGPPCATQFEHIRRMVLLMDATPATANTPHNFMPPRFMPDPYARFGQQPPCGCKKVEAPDGE